MEIKKRGRCSPEIRAKISEAKTGKKQNGIRYYRDNKQLANMWQTMKQRCYNPNREKYIDYGGRGIMVCDEWKESFECFAKWALSNGYKPGLQLDRIDNDGNYCPSNCRWVTPKENSRHTRKSKYLTLNNETKTVAEWCDTLPISQYTIYWWIKKYGEQECEKRIYERLSRTS